MNERTGPLCDIQIVDLTQALAGPYGTALLGDLGADVIKVEPPWGDMARSTPPLFSDYSPPNSGRRAGCDYGGYFASVNRNKRGVMLDIQKPDDRARFLKLIEKADAVVENSRVGVMDRLGLGYEALRKLNPRIVYAAIRGFGDPRTGRSPYSEWPAFDVVAQSMGGLVHITGPLGSAGFPTGASVGDIFPGVLMALGLVSAIHAAKRTGEGQFLDVAMYDAVLSLCETIAVNYSITGVELGPRGTGHPDLCPFDVYETRDGAVAIAAPTDNHWARLCELVDRRDLIADERTRDNTQRSTNRGFVAEVIGTWTRARTKREILTILGGYVPVGLVNTASEIFADPHVAARDMLPEIDLPGTNGSMRIVGTPIKFTGTPTSIYRRPPLLGEHNDEIFADTQLSTSSGRNKTGINEKP